MDERKYEEYRNKEGKKYLRVDEEKWRYLRSFVWFLREYDYSSWNWRDSEGDEEYWRCLLEFFDKDWRWYSGRYFEDWEGYRYLSNFERYWFSWDDWWYLENFECSWIKYDDWWERVWKCEYCEEGEYELDNGFVVEGDKNDSEKVVRECKKVEEILIKESFSKFVKCSIGEIVLLVKECYFVWKCVCDVVNDVLWNFDDSDD